LGIKSFAILAVFDILKGRSRFNTLVIKTVMTRERQGLTPEDFKKEWSLKKTQTVIGFYGEKNEFLDFLECFLYIFICCIN